MTDDITYTKGLELPPNIEGILEDTSKNLSSDRLCYEDAIILTCLKIKMTGSNTNFHIKQVVVDEAQDYYPMHFEILRVLYPNAKYTIVGDVNQTIEKRAGLSIYDDIEAVLCKRKTTTIFMSKSFRSSYEINSFSQRFIATDIAIESFERHGSIPEIVRKSSVKELDDAVIKDILRFKNLGYSSIAVVCKSMKASKELYSRLSNQTKVKLIHEDAAETMDGVLIVPIYMAKGLEFDAVLVYGMDEEKCLNSDDKKLLYIACTRALHQLSLYAVTSN